ncbi:MULTISPECIES: carbohydrate ABC transporter permease [Frigoribacterium]|jgi:alpha-glucoside transport system permease protein|uniref:carbohydrate ABC transporter permease n=1 Tax=Frigoribacterium TaxID=96492 RepID=UPI0006FECF6A|nr:MULTISPECIES: sugar ABC transporter permease [Frigoribacterium]KQM25518.1 ABC transporter permease [Frigoribacterium sp. Leaf8]MBD8139163.1 sugar ABC transporter permease [Frigoribacterium sp. CFBP 13605]MBD8485134.1 sugar ABC transporter permease [Frigoribacterium sp. CFBP 8759]ROS57161.1 alpha-glucoside transport system permease protein [Frigoribacterium sp. PhB118]WAC50949.1 sugar ABC transporter permease [Frigoribacterium sp. SL97]
MSSFFQWLAGIPPLAQIPLILIAFTALVAVVLVFVEFAPRRGTQYTIIRLAVCVVVPVVVLLAFGLYNSVIWVAAVAAVLGGGLFLLDYRSKRGAGYSLQLIAFMTPAVFFLVIGLIYPTITTAGQAFMKNDGSGFAGLDNFVWVFTSPDGLTAFGNTLVWVLLAPITATAIGLAYAVFIDKSRGEKFLKLLVFMPMAISFVGASIIFKFFYDIRQGEQIGLLNGILVAFGGQPVDWLGLEPWNTLLLVIVLIWTQAGFAMTVLSAAIKGVPAEQLEAASLDGTNGFQAFRHITVPGIRTTIIVVLTTISIASLKVYDIVSAMTGGRNDTTILAFEMVRQFQLGSRTGYSSALAVILFVLVLPIVIYNARQIQKQREIR